MRLLVPGLLLLVGCASAQTRTDKPLPPLPPAPGLAGLDGGLADPGANADFRLIVQRAANVYDPQARTALESFIANHPYHHSRPAATAMLIGVLLLQGDAAAAKNVLEQNETFLHGGERELFDGLCKGQLGDPRGALDVLDKYLGADPPAGIGGLPDADVRRLLRSTLAESLAATGKPGEAIDQLELYAMIQSDRPSERAYALQRAEEIAARVPAHAALDALAARRGLFARGVLGQKAVAALRARGDAARANQLDQEVMAIRRQIGLERVLPSQMPANPLRLGLVVPQTGPQARLGEVIMRGAALVVTAAMHAIQQVQYHLLLRDSTTPSERSPLGGGTAGGIVSLAREEKVIGLVSVPDSQGAEFAAREGVPLVLLDERTGPGQTTSFALIHSSEARATALARQALALGARRFAILGPDTPSGRRLSTAFKRAVQAGGGSVTGEVNYAPKTTSFANEVSMLRRLAFEGLFVPDDAGRLELIAPALAVADIWPRSPRTAFSASHFTASSGTGRRQSLLLSTALGISSKFLHNVERYVQGALLCPGFYPTNDNRSASFVSRFEATYGTQPTATDAYGYDGLFLLRGAVERGAKTRADVVRILASQTFEGLTGDVRFGRDRTRVDPPLVYVVEGAGMRAMKQ